MCVYAYCRYAATPMEVDWLCGQALASKPLCMGLDMEWRPQYRAGARQHPVALVQVKKFPHPSVRQTIL